MNQRSEQKKLLNVIDTHAHLDELQSLDSLLDKAREVGLTAIIAVGSNHESNIKVMEISERYPLFIYPALGLHPCELGGLESARIDYAMEFIEERVSDIVAIGEIGLDYDKRTLK